MTILRRTAATLALCIAAAVACISATLLSFADAQAQGRDPFTHFYRTNNLASVSALVQSLEARGILKQRNAQPPVIGFLTALFERNPGRLDAWAGGSYAQETQWIIANCLDRAGYHERAVAFARRNHWPAQRTDYLRDDRDGLMSMAVSNASHLDMLWGASFATGDARYVARIVDFFEDGVRSGTYSAKDLMAATAMAVYRNSPKSEAMADELRARYTTSDFIQLVYYGTALWALRSNARQHEFVRIEILKRISAKPEALTSRIMKTVVFDEQD